MHYAISTKVLSQTHVWYVLKHIRSNFLNFSLFMWYWIFTHTKLKHKRKIKKKKSNAYKEMQDAQNAWRYDNQCMKGSTKIERIRSKTKRVKAQS